MIRIDKIKDKLKDISILKVADELGIARRGRSARCFMHDDKNPSLGFNISKNTWKCYVCDKGGDQVTLVMEKLNLPFVDACKWLADRFNIIIPEDDGYRKKINAKKYRVKVQPKTIEKTFLIDVEMISWIVSHAQLSEKAKDFLFNQRKYKPTVVENLRIGSISYSEKLINALVKTFGLERALKSGVVRQNAQGLFLFFRTPCLIFPYTDIDGNIVNIQTRYIGTDKNAPRFQFLPNTVTRIFNMNILKQTSVDEKLFISEGITDCIALLSTNRKAVAIPSATLLNDADIKMLAPMNLYMYPDKDDAGERLYKSLSEKLNAYGSMVMKLQLPEGCKDFSDYYLKHISDNG